MGFGPGRHAAAQRAAAVSSRLGAGVAKPQFSHALRSGPNHGTFSPFGKACYCPPTVA